MTKLFYLWGVMVIVGGMFVLTLGAQVALAGHLGLPACYRGFCIDASGSFRTVGASYTGDLTVTQQLPPRSAGLYCVSLGFGWWSQSTGVLSRVYPSDPSTCNDVTTTVRKTVSFPGVDGGENQYEGAAQLFWWDASMNGGAGGFADLGVVTNSPTGRIALPAPTVSFCCSTTVTAGTPVTLSMTVSGTATSCNASGYWAGSVSTTGGSVTITPTVPGTYSESVQCSNGAGPGNTASVSITVNPPPPAVPQNLRITPAGTQRLGDISTVEWDPVAGAASYNFFSSWPVCAGGCPLTGTTVGPKPNTPAGPGVHSFWVKACNASGCGNSTNPVSVTIQSNGAAFVSQRVKNQTNPTTLTIGKDQNFRAEVTFQNTGTATWDDLSGYVLRSQNPAGNTTWRNASGVSFSEVALTATNPLVSSVPPGGQVTFVGDPLAPATAGTYNFQWQVYRKTDPRFPPDLGYFGVASTNVSITVPGAPSAVPIKVKLQIKARQHLPIQ